MSRFTMQELDDMYRGLKPILDKMNNTTFGGHIPDELNDPTILCVMATLIEESYSIIKNNDYLHKRKDESFREKYLDLESVRGKLEALQQVLHVNALANHRTACELASTTKKSAWLQRELDACQGKLNAPKFVLSVNGHPHCYADSRSELENEKNLLFYSHPLKVFSFAIVKCEKVEERNYSDDDY